MNIYKVLISMLIISSSSTLLKADIIILQDWTVIRGTSQAGNEKVLNITEQQSNKTITIRRDNIRYIVDENLVDAEIITNYKTFDWKNFDFGSLEEKKREIESRKSELEKSFIAIYRPRVGFSGGMSIGVGEVGPVLDAGYIIMLFNDYKFPLAFSDPSLDIRAGFITGYAGYTSSNPDFAADISLIQFIPYGQISYRSEIGLVPYFRLGTGLTLASLTDNSSNTIKQDATSTDPTLLIGAGTGYINENLPYIEFFFDFSFMRLFEKVSVNFVNMSIGASYHFYTPR